MHEIVYSQLGIIQKRDTAVHALRKVVRRNVGRHTDGDAVRTVDEDIRKTRRQHDGLHFGIVEVGIKVHRFLFDIAKHFRRKFGKTGFGITVSRRGIAVHRTEVSVPVHERKVDGKVLRKPYQRVVNRAVAVRVEFTEHFTDDLGAFFISFIVVKPHVVHGV